MKHTLLGAVAAFALVAVGFAGSADAQCLWTGYNWSCPAPTASYYQPYYGAYGSSMYPNPAYQPYYGWYGSTYPAYNQPDYGTGYKPNWVPSAPGPRASSGAGH